MEPGKALCCVCGDKAEMFCPCTAPETFLCVDCSGGHTVFRGVHPVQPISQLSDYKITGYSERLRTRLDLFPQVRDKVRDKVKSVDLAIQELTDEVDRVVRELVQYCNETVRKLKDTKVKLIRETEEALAEVERKIVEDRPQLTSEYGSVFRELSENLQPFDLFTYSVKTPPQTLVTFQSQLYPPLHIHLPDNFAALYYKQLEIYDLKTQQITQHTLSKSTGYAGYIEVDGTLMIVGEEVLTLDLHTFKISTLAPLLTPRYCPGVAKVHNDVLAFGGLNALKVCEKWSLLHTRWTPLPDMHYARGGFTPCHFKLLIYLAATYPDHRAVETFSPQTEIFTVLPVSLPPQLSLNCSSVAFVAFGELCILTYNKQIARWRIQSESEFRVSNTDRECYSNQQPLMLRNEMLIASCGRVVKLSLETYSFL